MGGKSPYDINIRLKKSKINSNGAYIEDLPKLPTLNDIFNLVYGCCIFECVSHHQYLLALFSQFNQLQSCFIGMCHRFLDEHMFPMQKKIFSDWMVGFHRSRDGHGIEVTHLKELFIV